MPDEIEEVKRCRFCNGPTKPFWTPTVLYDLCQECGELIPAALPLRDAHIDLNSVELHGGD
jgi:hypothetical protein